MRHGTTEAEPRLVTDAEFVADQQDELRHLLNLWDPLEISSHRVRREDVIIFRIAHGQAAETWFQGNYMQDAKQLGGRITTVRAPDRRA